MTSPLSGTRLDPILSTVAERAAARRECQSLESLRQTVQADPERRVRFCSALREPGLSIIAECKRRSPSVGQLTAETHLLARARAYQEGGAAAMSVLTEQDHFGGMPEDLKDLQEVDIPVLLRGELT